MSSLLDSVLLDPYRDPRELWIARRTDGQAGTGTIADPFDGSTTLGPSLAAQVTLKWNEFVVELGTIVANLPGFDVSNSKLRFDGVTGPAADWFNFSGPNHNEFRIVEVTRCNTRSNAPPSALGFVVEPVNPAAGYPDAPPNVQFTWNGYITASYTDEDGMLQATTVGAMIIWPVAKLAFSAPPNLVNFDAVELSGLDGSDSHFNGTYALAGRGDKSVRIRLSERFPDPPGTDITKPLSCVVRRLTYRFDQIMRAAPEYALIHLGPGTFETRGFTPAYISNQDDYRETFVGFVLRFGQRLRGSGIGATTVQLAQAVDELGNTVAIANPATYSADFAEVADLTVDSNAAGHSVPYGIFPAPVTCGAVGLGGSFMALRRVRAIHFCTQTLSECFVLALGSETNPDPVSSYLPTGTFNVIEDCILEQPGENNTHETTLVTNTGEHVSANARSPIIRRNYVNCEYSSGSSEKVALASYNRVNDHEFKVTTKRPHNRAVGQNVRINAATSFFSDTFKITAVVPDNDPSGEITCYSPGTVPTTGSPVGGHIGVDFHGPAALSGTGCVTEGNAVHDCENVFYADTGSTRDAVVRDNYLSNIRNGVYFNFSTIYGLSVEVPARLARTGVNLSSLTHMGTTANAQTASDHGLQDGEIVEISGVRIAGAPAPVGTYNGTFPIILDGPKSFHYTMANDPQSPADAPTVANPILVGIFSLTRDPNNPKVAILETPQPHGFKVGDAIEILGARSGSIPIPVGESYNDTVSVLAVLSGTRLSYEMKNNPGVDADGSTSVNPVRFRARWQVRRMTYERNLCDQYRLDSTSAVPGNGVGTQGYDNGPPFMYPQAIVRENFFRYLDDTPAGILPTSTFPGSRAVRMQSLSDSLLEQNLVNLSDTYLLHYGNGRNVSGFGNLTPSGQPVPLQLDISGTGDAGFLDVETLDVKVADALGLALL